MSRVRDVAHELRELWLERSPEDTTVIDCEAPLSRVVHSLAEALSEDALALIVEPKRLTHVRGDIHPDLDIADVAEECERAGAAAISVVTEPKLSGGSFADLMEARQACALPLLARDIIVDVRQVREARLAGADAVFLPIEVFVDEEDLAPGQNLHEIIAEAHACGMDVVLSVRNDEELELGLAADCDVLNIDNRDARGRIDVERTLEMLAEVPVGHPVISESVARIEEVAQLHRAGVDALLLDEGHLDTGLSHALRVYAELATR